MPERLSASLTTLQEQLLPQHSALLVIDMQNDFVASDGKMATFGFDVSGDTIHRGFALGYHIVAVEDCLADFALQGQQSSRTVHDVGMYITARHYGRVVKAHEVLGIWKAHLGTV